RISVEETISIPAKSRLRSDPQAALAIFKDQIHRVGGQSILCVVNGYRSIFEPGQAIVRAEPHRSLTITANCAHQIVGKSILCRKRENLFVFDSLCTAAKRPNPQAPFYT